MKKTSKEIKSIIANIEKKNDESVYKLYNLEEDEKKIVEGKWN